MHHDYMVMMMVMGLNYDHMLVPMMIVIVIVGHAGSSRHDQKNEG
jgi:hypothetical protein